MLDSHWKQLLAVLDGETMDPLPSAFIIDSPWLPGWAGMSIMDFYADGEKWFEANMRAIERFPDIWFLPGFWSEYGMCTEPSAFGAKCSWVENDLPHAAKILDSLDDLPRLTKPNPRTDGLAPFVLKRLEHYRPKIEEAGHAIRFATARGPLNIATFLMGTTEFLIAMRMEPDKTHALLETITAFLVEWLQVQAEAFPSIDGVLVLDDIVGFCNPDDFKEFAQPYLKRIFETLDVKVRFLHNDAEGTVCAPFLPGLGVNLFNFGFLHDIKEMQRLTENRVTLLGNIPPRDVLALGSPEEVRGAVRAILDPLEEKSRLICSCGGGMAPDTPTKNLEAFLAAVKE